MMPLFIEGKLYMLQPTNNAWTINSNNKLYVHLSSYKWSLTARRITLPINSTMMCLDTSEKQIKHSIRFLLGSKMIDIGSAYFDLKIHLNYFENDWKML